jgi:hypothetical protein
MHGILSFKLWAMPLAHIICAVGFFILAWVLNTIVAIIEFRSDIASKTLTAVRATLLLLILACYITIAAFHFLTDCSYSHITTYAAPPQTALTHRDSGIQCIPNPVIADPCLKRILAASSLCFVPPACQAAAVVLLCCLLMTLSVSFSTRSGP